MTWLPTGGAAAIAMIGHPVAQTVLPERFNAWFQSHEIDAVATPLDLAPAGLPAFFSTMRACGNFRGAVFTAPHKQMAAELVDTVSETAAAAGAVNIVVRDAQGNLFGDNIDGAGFMEALAQNGLRASGLNVLQFGCGGAGAAIAAQLATGGVSTLVLSDIDDGRATALALRIGAPCEARPSPQSVDGYDLVVNATTVGLTPGDMVHSLCGLSPEATVADIVTRRPLTSFLERAVAMGANIQTGAQMAEGQLLPALERFGFVT